MNMLKNILSVIGAIAIIGIIVAYISFGPKVSKLDPAAIGLYMQMAEDVMNTGDAAASMVKVVPLEEGVSPEDAIESIKSVAAENNMLIVNDTIMFRSGEKDYAGNTTRHVQIISLCNKQIAREFMDYSKAFGAFMPCRIILMEGKDGAYYLATMKLDLMIAGGHPLTPEMHKMALKVADTMYEAVDKGAKGDW